MNDFNFIVLCGSLVYHNTHECGFAPFCTIYLSKLFSFFSLSSFCGLSGAEIGRFVAMLRNPSSILKACAAFALLQVILLIETLKNEISKLVEFITSSIFPLNIWLGKFNSLLCEFNLSIAVYRSWWTACFAPCESHAECWSCTRPASCSCGSNCTTWSQNLCKNCAAQSWVPPYRIFNMKAVLV